MNLKDIPQAVTLAPEDVSIESIIEDFFRETEMWIRNRYKIILPSDIAIRFRPMGHDYAQDHIANGLTDDIARYLSYQDSVVAAVFATRNDFNNVRYSFFRRLENINERTAGHVF